MSILAGLSIVAVICLGALFWSFIKPAGSIGTSKIVADQDSGAIYVRVNETLYPALNLSSARLIAGRPPTRYVCVAARSTRARAGSWSVSLEPRTR